MIANHVGRQVVLSALGREWTVARLERRDWDEWLGWARPRIPDPLEVAAAALEKFPPERRDALVRHAVELASEYMSIGSRQVQRCLNSLEGSTRFLWMLLRKNHPDITEDAAFDIAVEVGAEELKKAFDRASGVAPPAGKPEPASPPASTG